MLQFLLLITKDGAKVRKCMNKVAETNKTTNTNDDDDEDDDDHDDDEKSENTKKLCSFYIKNIYVHIFGKT